ncbi:MAG: two-component system, OmpR family, sensor kinase [Actinomycetota bacterium]|nr:two-component system, OmpR family, sensor kinase [Actinomycetota bacterium]
MLLLVAMVTFVVVRGQQSAADNLLRTTAASADDVGDPPPGAWLVLVRGGVVSSSPGLPTKVAPLVAELRSGAGSRVQIQDIDVDDGGAYRVATQRRSQQLVQVVLDLRREQSDRARLLKTMGAAGGLALVVAAALGALLGRRAVRPLVEALELQRTFVADASHELRTPLTLLSTRAQLVNEAVQRGHLDDDVLADSAGIVADVHRLGEVLEDLLVAADPAGQAPAEVVELAELVTGAVDSARAHAEQAGVTLAAHVSPAPERTQVRGASAALRRAVLSLVDNAIDHTPTHGAVTVRVERRGGDVVITVSDSGPGIEPAAAKQILQRFHSGGQRAGRAHYGLGLALSHDVANRHGGRLRLLDSAIGATFELTVPAAD